MGYNDQQQDQPQPHRENVQIEQWNIQQHLLDGKQGQKGIIEQQTSQQENSHQSFVFIAVAGHKNTFSFSGTL
jgi:hypothetical protein